MTDTSSSSAPAPPVGVAAAGMADHVADARRRARDMLSCETHLGDVDDWRQAIVTARDGVLLVWLLWVAMYGCGSTDQMGPILVAAALGISLFLGLGNGIATRRRLRYYESELERERREIETHPEEEREEVRALYAAKGFNEPLLTHITDTLCADDDRLLKVMMEEELGLFIQHINHPLLVGLWNGAGAAVGTLAVALPTCVPHPALERVWPAGATVVLLAALGTISARVTHRSIVPVVGGWLGVAAVAGGVTYFSAELLAGRQ